MKRRVLVVDDDQSACDLLAASLGKLGYDSVPATSGLDALDVLGREDFDAVLTDLRMPDMDGLELCKRAMETQPGLPVILVTGQASMEAAVLALRSGAYDFVTKPIDSAILGACLSRATQSKALRREVERLKREVDGATPSGELVGTSVAMRRIYDLIARVAATDATILIHGETGTGKELVARAIHDKSPRREGPFVAINCAAVPANLIESELFGHARGAFTDAKGQRSGLFVEANGGTLFLDEIGELPLDIQPKLLRALQERKVRPLGANAEMTFDARIVAATNRDLETEVAERRFREDLYYRVNVVTVDLPPLRERGTDILAIAQKMLKRFAGQRKLDLSQHAAEKLISYDWPGNVRELENCMERAAAMARYEHISVDDFPERIRNYRADAIVLAAQDASELVTVDELERRYIFKVLKMVGGNKSRAAQILGVDRRTLYRKLERFGEPQNPKEVAEEAP